MLVSPVLAEDRRGEGDEMIFSDVDPVDLCDAFEEMFGGVHVLFPEGTRMRWMQDALIKAGWAKVVTRAGKTTLRPTTFAWEELSRIRIFE
jgi:hypothetical protein